MTQANYQRALYLACQGVDVGCKTTQGVSMEHPAKGTRTIESRGKINFAPHVIRKEREQDIQRTIIAWLRLKRYFWWRNNVGAVNYQGKTQNRYVRFGTKGAPDLFVVRKVLFVEHRLQDIPRQVWETQIWGIECKRPNGSQSQDQRAFEAAFREAGGYYLVAKRLEDVTEVLG